jgi:hypothetical protein
MLGIFNRLKLIKRPEVNLIISTESLEGCLASLAKERDSDSSLPCPFLRFSVSLIGISKYDAFCGKIQQFYPALLA